MRPAAAVDPGGGRESRRGAAGQRAARPGRHGGDAAPEAEVMLLWMFTASTILENQEKVIACTNGIFPGLEKIHDILGNQLNCFGKVMKFEELKKPLR